MKHYKLVMKGSTGWDGATYWKEFIVGEDEREYRNTPEIMDNAELVQRERRLRKDRIGNRRYGPTLTQYRYY